MFHYKLAPHPECEGDEACICPQCMAQLQKEVEEIEKEIDEGDINGC